MASKHQGRGRGLLGYLRMASGVVLAECAQEVHWRRKNGLLTREAAASVLAQLKALGYTGELEPPFKDLFELTKPVRLDRCRLLFRCERCGECASEEEETDEEDARLRLMHHVRGDRLPVLHRDLMKPERSCRGLMKAIAVDQI